MCRLSPRNDKKAIETLLGLPSTRVSGGSRVVRSESRGKEPKKGEECGDVEDEIDRVVGDVGDDPDDGRIKVGIPLANRNATSFCCCE